MEELEAKLEYDNATFRVVRYGTYVKCAVTGQRIPLPELRYWSVERQEPYLNCEAGVKRYETKGE